MADTEKFNETVPNYLGGKDVGLEVGSNDGHVYIRLRNEDESFIACLIEPDIAETFAAGLQEALTHLRLQAPPAQPN